MNVIAYCSGWALSTYPANGVPIKPNRWARFLHLLDGNMVSDHHHDPIDVPSQRRFVRHGHDGWVVDGDDVVLPRNSFEEAPPAGRLKKSGAVACRIPRDSRSRAPKLPSEKVGSGRSIPASTTSVIPTASAAPGRRIFVSRSPLAEANSGWRHKIRCGVRLDFENLLFDFDQFGVDGDNIAPSPHGIVASIERWEAVIPEYLRKIGLVS